MVRLFAAMLAAFFLFAGNASAINKVDHQKMAKEFSRKTDIVELAVETDRNLNAMIRLAIFNLRLQGRGDLADQIKDEWENQWQGALVTQTMLKDLGDHEPLSQWLAVVTATIELVIGPQAMKFLHLDDLVIINYAIPVVFNPTDPEWDQAEYKLHFVPLAGVTAYWGSYIACVGATWGGGIVFLCTPVGMISENLVVKFVAPKMSDRVYVRANSRE